MTTLATLVVKLTGDIGHYSAEIEKAEKKTRGALGNIGSAAAGLAATAGAAFIGIGAAALASGQKIDAAYDSIITKTGATGATLETLKGDFGAVFKSIPTDAQTAGDVIGELNQKLGVTGKPLQDISRNLLEMSRLLETDATTNAALFGRVMGDWGIQGKDATAMLDRLFVATQKSGIGVDRLMGLVVQFGAPLRNMGFTVEESVAMLAKWEKEGVNTELVLGSLRIAAGKFAKDGKPLRESLLSTIKTIQGMKDGSAALALGMQTFGARAGPDMVAAIREGRFAVEDMIAAMEGAEGAIANTAAATEDFPEKFAKMRNKVELALAPLGMAIMDAIGGAMDAIGPVLETAIPQIIGAFESVVTWIRTNIAPAFESVQSTIGGFAEGAREIWERFSGQIISIATSVWESLQSIVGGVLNAVREFIREHGDEIRGFLQSAWERIQGIVRGALDIINATVVPVLQGIANFIQTHGDTIKGVLETAWNAIRTVVETVLGVIQGLIDTVMAVIHGDWEKAWEKVKETALGIWQGIQKLWDAFWSGVDKILKTLSVNVQQGWDNFWNGVRTTVETIWNGIVSFLQGVVNGAIGIINGLIDAFNNTIGKVAGEIPRIKEVAWTTQQDLDKAGQAMTGSMGSMFDIIEGMMNERAPTMFDKIVFAAEDTKALTVDKANEMIRAWMDALNQIAGISIPAPQIPNTPAPATTTTTTKKKGKQLGGLVDEGWWFLHANEFVLSEAMRLGRAAVPAEAFPGAKVAGVGEVGGRQTADGRWQQASLAELAALLRTLPRDVARAVRDGVIQASA